MHKGSLMVFSMVWLVASACGSKPDPERGNVVTPTQTKRMVGELERLGKNEQDFLVLVQIGTVDELTVSETDDGCCFAN